MKTKKEIHYLLIVDKSGSMSGLRHTVVNSFNEQIDMIRNLAKDNPLIDFKVSLISFNDRIDLHYLGRSISKVNKLTLEQYNPDSMTALYDAIGFGLSQQKKIVSKKDEVMVAIFTDGMENSSKEYNAKDIQNLMKKYRAKGWEFNFFCSTEDAVQYQDKLELEAEEMTCMSMDEAGFSVMKETVARSMKKMASKA